MSSNSDEELLQTTMNLERCHALEQTNHGNQADMSLQQMNIDADQNFQKRNADDGFSQHIIELERHHTPEQSNENEADVSTQLHEDTERNVPQKRISITEGGKNKTADIDTTRNKKEDASLPNEENGFKKDNVSDLNNDCKGFAVGTKAEQRRSKRKKKQSQSKMAYISSSDENLPLSVYLQREKMKVFCSDLSDNDKTFVPVSKDLNSTDSEFYSDVSTKTRQDMDFNENLKQEASKKLFKKKQSKKVKHSTRKQRKACSEDSTFTDLELQQVKSTSIIQALVHNSIVRANEGRLDQNLYSNNLKRYPVPRHGNCFFDAALLAGSMAGTSSELRQTLCKHLEEHKNEYIGFMANKYSHDTGLLTTETYRQEIKDLGQNGYWSSRVADFLPLALANHTKTTVKIYTSKPEQPLIVVNPTQAVESDVGEICLAYISVPNVLEHYDACEPITTANTDKDNISNNYQTSSLHETDEQFYAVPLQKTLTQSTPKKRAKFVTPVKKKLSRKRKATPENWKRNVRKQLRLSGKGYTSATGKIVPEKTVKQCDCTKCRYKCNSKFTEEERQCIFNSFWSMESYERQKDYICARVLEKKTKTYLDDNEKKVPKKKQVSRVYTFEFGEQVIQVCKRYFLRTLSVGEAYVVHALTNKVTGHFQGGEKRGKKQSANKTSADMVDGVKRHIKSFPTVESHYTRKDTNRQYLEPILSVPKMYDLYKEKCQENQQSSVKLSMYRRIFNESFNLSFHIPKKDQCNLRSKYHIAEQDGTLTDKMKEEFNMHQKRKVVARDEKANDKSAAKANPKIHSCTFDLQSVLYTPCSLVSVMYYMRKLCCYNLSVYSLGTGEGSCFLWSEVNGKRGSSEIATCINHYLKSLPSVVEHVIFYSDACTGQNRNQIMATSLMLAVNAIDHIKIIDHKFLESGHTHMECDSMHAAIEFAKKKTQINVPSQWETVITMARRNNPYHVETLRYSDFIDFNKLKSQNLKVGNTDSGMKVSWSQMKWMRFISNDPGACLFKYDMKDKDFERMLLVQPNTLTTTIQFPIKYSSRIPISSAKKKDLVNLCKNGTIPKEFHEYYKTLPSSQSTKDILMEPDANESDVDTEDE